MKKISLITCITTILAALFLTSCKEPKPTPVVEKVKTPVIGPEEGIYNKPIDVSISCAEESASIFYTTDGSTPNSSSNFYEGEFLIEHSCTVKAIATIDGKTDSDIASATYTIDKIVANPMISHESGTYEEAITISLSCATEGANIYYTTDGSIPNILASELYKEPFLINKSCTLNVKAFKPEYESSEVISAEYVIELDLSGMLSLTYNNEISNYNITHCTFTANESRCHLDFETDDENVRMSLHFRSNKPTIGSFEFSANNSTQTGTVSENNCNYIIERGIITIELTESNKYRILIEDAIIHTTNSIPQLKKLMNFEFEGALL